jgi:hypothetical protein
MVSLLMTFFALRPLLTALIEYGIAIGIFYKGRFLRVPTFFFLIFLATYQLGEFLFIASDGNRFWLSVSLFSTNMLPPYGLLLIQKLSKRKTPFLLILSAALFFGAAFLIIPQTIPAAKECNCFVKYSSANLSGTFAQFFHAWAIYYIVSLTLSMLLMMWFISRKQGDIKNLRLLLIGYTLFFPFSYFITKITSMDLSIVASIMCSLAIFTGFIVSHISISKKKDN